MTNRYVAFLRGINSGSNPTLKMDILRGIFENLGFQNVKTLLASGNVVFDTDRSERGIIEPILEKELETNLGYKVAVIVLNSEEIKRLIESNPFEGISITPQTRLYITFTKGARAKTLALPFSDAAKGFVILGEDHGIIRSTVDLNKGMTPDLMSALDKNFGKNNTTRNWNTIEKVFSMVNQP
jgi:uncharacterized protein (DUF1697 family)